MQIDLFDGHRAHISASISTIFGTVSNGNPRSQHRHYIAPRVAPPRNIGSFRI